MQSAQIWSLVLLVAICGFVDGEYEELSDYEVGTENYKEKQKHSYRVSALTVSKGIAEVGKTFHYGIIGGINKVTKKGDVDKIGFFMRKIPALKHIPKLAGAFGAIGTMLSIVFSFLPMGYSPELEYIKHAFSRMNKKLDIITNSLDESKKLIKEYSQKSAYIQAEHNIIRAYNQFNSLVSSLIKVDCASEADCKQKKMNIVDNYKDRLDVRGDVEMILRGATHNMVFGTSPLSLISETSGCYISKIKNLQSAIAALATKGISAAALHAMTTKAGYDMAADVKEFQMFMFDLEKKAEDIIFKCYQNINRYIVSDVIDLDNKLSQSFIKDANRHILKFLSIKYPWIEFYVISAKVGSNAMFWANDSFHNEVNSKREFVNENTRNFVLTGSRNRVQNKLKKEVRFREKVTSTQLHSMSWFKVKYDEAVDRLLDVVEYDKYLHNQFRTIILLPEYNDALIGYIGAAGTVEQVNRKDYHDIRKSDLIAYEQCRRKGTCSAIYQPVAVIASIQSQDQDISECTKTCDFHGKCFFLPHTKMMRCKCNADYYGEDCTLSVSGTYMALDLIKLIDISFKLPSLFDVSVQLGDVRVALQTELNDIQNSIQALDKKLTSLFDTLNKDLMTSLVFHGLITQYGQIIRDLKYYYQILIERDDTSDRPGVALDKRMHKMQYIDTKEKKELARKIIEPTELRRSLKYLNYLFFGRQTISLISHKPLLFLVMDKYRRKLCNSEYKKILDNAYKQLVILEFQGHIVWMQALDLLQLDTSFVVKRYESIVNRHKNFFDSNTCQVKISNSVNFENCTNGYYIHSGMKEEVKCADNFYLTSRSVSLYVSEIIRVSGELSSTMSSAKEILGRPDVYPIYGNSSQAWSPSSQTIKQPQFIEVAFKDPLFIEEIKIYETFHGGAVWKIEGMYRNGVWKVLMEKSKQSLRNIQSARIYAVKGKTDWSTSKLRLNIDCSKYGKAVQIDAIQINGRPKEGTCSWYDSFSCTACDCDSVGSSSRTCSRDGQCRCKSGYRGKRCLSRDCVIGHWSAWSSCECGPGKTKTRTRPITQKRIRSGTACGKTSETIACSIKCQCGEGEKGNYCEHKDCRVSSWSSWDDCPETVLGFHCNGDDNIYPKTKRFRSITRNKQSKGAACPDLTEEKLCKEPLCTEMSIPQDDHFYEN